MTDEEFATALSAPPAVIPGVDPNAPIATNERGGKQSAVSWRFDLLGGPAVFRLARVLDYGAKKYAPNNWRKISTDEHLNHMAIHLFAYWAGDRSDDHIGHILCRAWMAAEIAETQDGYNASQADEVPA